MNAQQRELFRLALLRVLEANNTERGLGAQALQLLVGAFGFAMPALPELRAEIQYLADKGLVEPVGKAISPENKCWRITAAGRDELAQHG